MAIKYFGLQLWHIGLTPASGITLCLAYIPLEFWVSVEWAPTSISVSNVVGSSSLRASDYLSEQMKNTNGLLRLYAYWARLEQSMGKDTVSARSVWERLLKISGTMLEAWQSYISMEIELGHINEARSIHKKCYSKRLTRTGSELKERNKLRKGSEDGTRRENPSNNPRRRRRWRHGHARRQNNPKPTTKANSSDSSDASDSDSDSDSEDEAKQNMELQTLEYQLSNEPSNYDTYVQETGQFTFYEGLNRIPDFILKDKAVAELGCGNGWITIAIAEKWLPLKFCWFVVLMPCESFCFLPYQCLQGLHHDFSHHFLSLCFVYGLDINPRAIKISWIQLYLNALDESFSKLFRHCHCKRSFVLMVICGAGKKVLNSNSNAMSKIITENASEEFLYSLRNYCGLQPVEQLVTSQIHCRLQPVSIAHHCSDSSEEDNCGDDDDDDVDGEDEIDVIDDEEVPRNL
ncbi:hypothetical protein WN943_005780 [Citrus x changshan-huyou]